MRAVGYFRQSQTRGDRESASVADQRDAYHAWCERTGAESVGEYADPDAPWDDLDKRERWGDLLADLPEAAPDAVWAYDTSRLWRDLEWKLATCRVLAEAGVGRLVTGQTAVPTDGSDDPEGELVGNMMAAVAQFDNALRRSKVRAAHRRLARDGKWSGGGHRPYGYTKGRTAIVDAEAAVIREAFARITGPEKVTIGRLATEWNEAGLRTTQGNRWTRGGLTRLLTSPALAGLRETKSGHFVEGSWDGILTPAERDEVVAVLADRRYKARQPEARLLTASRLLHCGICRQPMTGSRRARSLGGERVYRCAKRPENDACGRLTVMAHFAEDEVRDRVLAALDGGLVERHVSAALLADKKAKAARDTLGSVGSRRAMIMRLAARSGDEVAAQGALDDLAAEERAAREVLERQVNGIGLLEEAAKGPAAWWKAASDDARRELLDAAILRITVKPGRGGRVWRPERIAIDWRV